MKQLLAVIVVTHNSHNVIADCVDGLARQHTSPHQVIIVDSGSDDSSYLEPYRQIKHFQIHCRENIGFSAANNIGLGFVDNRVDFVLFINPDTFLTDNCLVSALETIQRKPQTAILTGILKGYDSEKHCPSGLLDSTGIFRTWYGRWYDRGQGKRDDDQYKTEQEVPAVCGAFMLCRKRALESVVERQTIGNRSVLFDESFFMYKEDIDLSLRLRKKGWHLLYAPQVIAYHARGWAKDRKAISYEIRCMSSANEIRLNLKHHSPYLIWSVCKYLAVRILRV